MFCKSCGQEINANAIVCPNCGVATDNMAKAIPVPSQKNTMALVGFILSFFVSIAGLVVSIIAYQNAKKPEYNGDGKTFATAGIIISAVSIGISLIAVVVYFIVLVAIIGMLPPAYY